jgi:LPXTG-motif cell wall-anchored protein
MGQPFPFKGGKAKSDDTKDTEKTGGSASSAVIWIIAGLAVVAGGGMFFLFRKNSGA